MKRCWAVYTVMCTQPSNSSSFEYEHQDTRDILHQSQGGSLSMSSASVQHGRACGATHIKIYNKISSSRDRDFQKP